MTDVRETALVCLMRILEKGEYSHVVLKAVLEAHEELEKRDRAFLTRLVEGTIEHLYELDYIIDTFSKTKTAKQKPVIREILRMGVYQIRYMNSVPDRAAVNESVRLTVKRGYGFFKGFVNGVLRAVSGNPDGISWPKREDGFAQWARVKYSMPVWITEKLLSEYGEERTEGLLVCGLSERPLTVRCNESRASLEETEESLRSQNIGFQRVEDVPGALLLENYDNPAGIRAFEEGHLQVQDVSSMLVGLAAQIKPGDCVLDVCAAPGGKSLHAADLLAGTGHVEARDLTPEKVALIRENIRRSRLTNISAKVWDALNEDPEKIKSADVVLADLPCSGMGIIGRKSDIKYRLTEASEEELCALQRKILQVVWKYVKPGGRLVFSTCTVFPGENRDNARWFLEHYPFEQVDLKKVLPKRFFAEGEEYYDLQLLPGEKGTDGFFIAAFTRKSDT